MVNTPTIRFATTEEDFTKLRALRWVCYAEHESKICKVHWDALASGFNNTPDPATNDYLHLVAELDGEFIAALSIDFNPQIYETKPEEVKIPELRLLCVSPAARGHGLAKQLITKAAELSRQRGFDQYGLHTAEFMEDAVALYGKLGFQRYTPLDFTVKADGMTVMAFRKSIVE